MGNQEVKKGKLSFDAYVDGEKFCHTDTGLLAYNEGDTLQIMVKGFDIELMVETVISLTQRLVELGCGDFLMKRMDEELGERE